MYPLLLPAISRQAMLFIFKKAVINISAIDLGDFDKNN